MSLKDLSGRLARWSLRLQCFDFDIEHRKGSENIVADTLSRMVDELNINGNELLDMETIEFESDEYLAIIEQIVANKDRLPDLKIDNGVIFMFDGKYGFQQV